ncbi:TPA: hypothetical protein ACX6QN_003591 [Photobacterium damselae]
MNKIDKNKILFLWLNDKEFHAEQASKRGVTVREVFKVSSRFVKMLRRIYLKVNCLSVLPWLNPAWARNLNEFNTVIIHASKLTPPVVKYISNTYPKIRIIIWYWNPVSKSVPIERFSKYGCEIWTFDKDDSIKFNIKYNLQYYFNNVKPIISHTNNDVFFVGGDKGRLDYLLKIKSQLESLGIKSIFNITNTSKIKIRKGIYQNRISYDEVMCEINNSKAIIDVVSKNQSGLTLRPLEAMFFRKKLITNDFDIVNRDFYSKENVFILGKDNINNLPYFLQRPYKEIPDSILLKYDFDLWLFRFFE